MLNIRKQIIKFKVQSPKFKENNYLCSRLSFGEVLEWLKRHAWKACSRQNWLAGSNPVLSAGKEQVQIATRRNLFFY